MKHVLVAAAALCGLVLGGCASVAPNAGSNEAPRAATKPAPVKVVYHLTEGLDQSQRAMGNIRNHLNAEPGARIVVVGNADGILFMLDGAKDRNGYPFDATIQDLKAKGVDFRICGNTLAVRKIDRAKAIPDVSIVDSGVAEAARLQAREGFVYLRP
jgi:intracellular sulfur oxidation DsrE/DsrF family protein